MRLASALFWLIGLAGLVLLLRANDFAVLAATVGRLEWGLLIVFAFHAVPLGFDVLGWRALFLRAPPLRTLARARWMGEAANGLLPVPHLGELLRIKLPYDAGTDLADAASSVTADITAGLGTQIAFVAVGLLLFTLDRGDGALLRSILTVAALAWFGVSFYWAQRARLFSRVLKRLSRRVGGKLRPFDGTMIARIEDALDRVYQRRQALAMGLVWRLLGWFAGAGEIWLVPWLLGRPIGLDAAIVLESLSQGARAAAFVIPGGLGVQDGTLMVLAAQLGYGPELGLVISLVKRLRELALGVPPLALAYGAEMRGIAAHAGRIRAATRASTGMKRGRNSRGS